MGVCYLPDYSLKRPMFTRCIKGGQGGCMGCSWEVVGSPNHPNFGDLWVGHSHNGTTFLWSTQIEATKDFK